MKLQTKALKLKKSNFRKIKKQNLINKNILNYPTVQLFCRSERLATDIHDIFLRFSLNSKKTQHFKRGKLEYAIRLYGFDQLSKFTNRIGFNHPAKANKVTKTLEEGIKRARRSVW